eukprot:maker-scaffold68_size422247-snap-gene-0.14 protein:Tk11382 transcript:maker-scaffold68_size422247-snap-gene-0.14-mRNA-1 annotation:"unnamed protein product"
MSVQVANLPKPQHLASHGRINGFIPNGQPTSLEGRRELKVAMENGSNINGSNGITRQISQYITLRDGTQMPRIGLGTWKSPPDQTKAAVKTAIEAGYRLIDCANDYNNEHVIGEALKELLEAGTIKREELFIQCKLWNSNHRTEHVRQDLMASLEDLQLDYVDSFVIHWPQAVPSHGENVAVRKSGTYIDHYSKGTMMPIQDDGYYSWDKECHYMETWHAMEDLVDEGLCKTIGLSNFNLTQVREVMMKTKKHYPVVLQNESHPYLQEKDLRDFCRIHKIAFQAYSALGSFDRPWKDAGSITSGSPVTGYELLDNPVLIEMGKSLGKSPAQVVLRWHLEMGGTAVCKSVRPERIISNYGLWNFELTHEDLAQISDLNVGWRHLLWAETALHFDYPFKDFLPWDYLPGKPDLKALSVGPAPK